MNEILIFSGAGLSAESGLRTFRDNGGLWNNHDPRLVASIETLDENRELVFSFYNERRRQLADAQPNRAHHWLRSLQVAYGERVRLFTQNVDDLLERAGCTDVVHLHGSLLDGHCRACGHHWHIGYRELSPQSTCPQCASRETKPGIVMFGEEAPLYAELHETFSHSRDDLILVIGTSGNVIPFEYVVGNRRSTRRSYTVLNNLERDPDISYHQYFDQVIFKPATEACEELAAIVEHWIALRS